MKSGFQAGYPHKYTWGHGAADKTIPAMEDTERRTEIQPYQQGDFWEND